MSLLHCNVHVQVDIAVDPLDGTTLVSQVRNTDETCLCRMNHRLPSPDILLKYVEPNLQTSC